MLAGLGQPTRVIAIRERPLQRVRWRQKRWTEFVPLCSARVDLGRLRSRSAPARAAIRSVWRHSRGERRGRALARLRYAEPSERLNLVIRTGAIGVIDARITPYAPMMARSYCMQYGGSVSIRSIPKQGNVQPTWRRCSKLAIRVMRGSTAFKRSVKVNFSCRSRTAPRLNL